MEDFDEILEELLDKATGAQLLQMPGLYEVVSEHFNNEVLDEMKLRKSAAIEEAANDWCDQYSHRLSVELKTLNPEVFGIDEIEEIAEGTYLVTHAGVPISALEEDWNFVSFLYFPGEDICCHFYMLCEVGEYWKKVFEENLKDKNVQVVEIDRSPYLITLIS